MNRKLKKFLQISLILLSMSTSIYPEENLRDEAESLANAWLIGASFIPGAIIQAGVKDNNGVKTEINWIGSGFSAESMYVTSLYDTEGQAALFLSLNTSLDFIEWDEQSLSQKDIGEIENYKKDKGYSILLTQKFRINTMGWNTLGCYVEADAGLLYSHPENLDPDEKMNTGFDPTFGGGLGVFVRFPGYNALLLDFEMNCVLFESDNPDMKVNYIGEFKFSAVYEIF